MLGALRATGHLSPNIENDSDVSLKMGLMKRKHLDTYRHCVRVAWLSEKLAAAMRMEAVSISNLVRGCFIHDLGKLMIPNEVLDTDQPLTNEQWELIKQHPEFGAEMLRKKSEICPEIIQLVLHHHERWDAPVIRIGCEARKFLFWQGFVPSSTRLTACCLPDRTGGEKR